MNMPKATSHAGKARKVKTREIFILKQTVFFLWLIFACRRYFCMAHSFNTA